MNNEPKTTVVDNTKEGGLDETLGIGTEDATTKETAILDAVVDDISGSTEEATVDSTVVDVETAGVEIRSTGVGVESTGVGIETEGVQTAAHKD